jgi:acetoin utilization deacetylase AcuC-like enzyme
MTTLLLTHPACLEHDTGVGHPERADRLRAIDAALAVPAFKDLRREEAPRAELSQIERLHPKAYVEMIQAEIPKQHHKWLDPDTVVSPGSWEAVLRATGAAIHAVDQVAGGEVDNAFCAIRPPGHHAEPSRAMGFCLFNSVAVAALHARAAFTDRILPALDAFAPDFLLVSAGFDAHLRDPLAQIRLLEPDFAWVTEKLLEAAAKHSGGKLVSTLEGGYDLEALADSSAVHVKTLMGA